MKIIFQCYVVCNLKIFIMYFLIKYISHVNQSIYVPCNNQEVIKIYLMFIAEETVSVTVLDVGLDGSSKS